MDIKTNDATLNRPEGKRLVDAPAVLVDIQDFIDQLKDESAWEKSDRNGITVFKTPGLTVVLSALRKGAEMKELQVDGLLALQVVEGEISVSTSDDQTRIIKEKQLLVLHPGAKHNLVVNKETILLLSTINAGENAA
ncbi:MAG: hypothetical protein ABI813_00045 [Bacteroidota bacterium]